MIHEVGKDRPYPKGKEDRFQRAAARWLDAQGVLWFHPPNGGKRNRIEAAIFKGLGVKAGVPDIVIMEPRGRYHGMLVELKVAGGSLTDNQRAFLTAAAKLGYKCVVAWNLEEMIKEVESYLAQEPDMAMSLLREYGRHAEGCDAAMGAEYRCRCGWHEFEKMFAE